MDWDPIRTSSAADLSLVVAHSDDESGSVAEFVIDLAARHRGGAPLRVDSELAELLTVGRDVPRPQRSAPFVRRLAAAALPVVTLVGLASANALPAAAQGIVARAASTVGI